MGSGGGQTQTTKSEPWSGQQPYLTQGFQGASNIYQAGPAQYYPGQTYADMSDPTKAGLQGIVNQASGSNPITSTAGQYTKDVLSGNTNNPYAPILGAGAGQLGATAGGGYLGSNPFLDSVYSNAARNVKQDFENTVIPGITSAFGQSGTTGSALMGESLANAGGKLGDTLSGLASSIYAPAYENERTRQVQAGTQLANTGTNLFNTGVNQQTQTLGLSPSIAQSQFLNPQMLLGAGQGYEDFANKALQDDISRFNYNQNADLSALQDYLALISGNYGGTSVTRSSSSGNPLSTALGSIATIGSMG